MPRRDAPPTFDIPAANTLRRLSALLPFIGILLAVALIVWRRPGPGFDDVGSVAAVLGFAVLAVVAYRLELAAGHRQARAAKAALDEYDAGLSRLPKSGLSPADLGHLAGGRAAESAGDSLPATPGRRAHRRSEAFGTAPAEGLRPAAAGRRADGPGAARRRARTARPDRSALGRREPAGRAERGDAGHRRPLGEKALAEHDPQLARIVGDGKFAERQPEYWADTGGAF